MKFLESTTRNLFFTGKGGVGKTSVACAAAVQLADAGKKVLLVSTDPASNLDEVLGTPLGHHPTVVPSVPGLSAMNLDPEKSAAEYRERMVGPYRAELPAAAIASMEEQFSGSCTLEIAAFDEFSRLLGDASATSEFDHVIFDTAPTGHTLRLLTLPSAWAGFMEKNTTGTSCLGPLASLQAQQKLYRDTVKALSDPLVTTLVLVARSEATALREAARTSKELAGLGVQNQHLVINGVFRATDSSDPYALAMEKRGETAMKSIPKEIENLRRTTIPLSGSGVLGIAALRSFGVSVATTSIDSAPVAQARTVNADSISLVLPPLIGELIDDLAEKKHGVILAMGKGGVGKTTVAAAVAVALAKRGFVVHLSTTDPAAHIAAAVAGETFANLTVSRIDPVAETAKYSAEVMTTAGSGLDEQGKSLLAEDLRSPCTEEIAVFRAFADAVAEGSDGFVVLDTAPTGHTVLLLDSALAYHREVTRQSNQMPDAVSQLLPRLRDPDFTRILIVTLPEATPVHEAAALQRDLRRAGIEPYAWVINQCLSPLSIHDPLLQERQLHELPYIREVMEQQSRRSVILPWQIDPPVGKVGLEHLLQVSILRFYPELNRYLTARVTEFECIPQERKADLQKLANYVRECLSKSVPAKLTFICTHNSRRSHLAQVWAQVAAEYYCIVGVATYSGGTEATAFNPRAVDAMRRCGLKISSNAVDLSNPRYEVRTSDAATPQVYFSKVYDAPPNPTEGYCAIMTCSQADDACPLVMGCDLRLPIRYEDPKIADDTDQEIVLYDERSRQICREMLYAMSSV